MCIILDVHKVDSVFGRATRAASVVEKNVARRIIERTLGLAAGGTRYFRELRDSVSHEGQQFFLENWRNPSQPGPVQPKVSALFDEKEQKLIELRVCQSNDEHIIAIAMVTGARLLMSDDLPLGRDFRDRNIVDPPGRVVPEDADRRQIERLLDSGSICSPQRCGRRARRTKARG